MAGLKPILITAFGLGVAAFVLSTSAGAVVLPASASAVVLPASTGAVVLPASTGAANTTSIPPVYVLFPPERPLIVIVPPPRPGTLPAPTAASAVLPESTPASAPESAPELAPESVLSETAPSLPRPPAVLAALDVLPPPRPSAPAPAPTPALAALQPALAPALVPPANLPDNVTTLEPTDDIDEVLLVPDQSERADLQKLMIEQVVLDQAAQDQGDSLAVLPPENPRIMAAKTPEPRLLQPQDTAPVASPKLGSVTSILFAPEDNQLDDVGRIILQHFIAGIKTYSVRLQLLAYAGAPGDQRSPARRLALKRALEIRDYLMAAGITPEQIDVRALGGALEGPPDRVELILLQ